MLVLMSVLPWVPVTVRGDRPGESRKASVQGTVARDDARNCSGTWCSLHHVEGLSVRAFCSPRKQS